MKTAEWLVVNLGILIQHWHILSGDLAIYKQHRTNFQLYAAVFQPFVMVSMFVCSFFVMVGFQFYFMGVYVFVSDSLVVQSSTVIILLKV